jgi:hypothetical protein
MSCADTEKVTAAAAAKASFTNLFIFFLLVEIRSMTAQLVTKKHRRDTTIPAGNQHWRGL